MKPRVFAILMLSLISSAFLRAADEKPLEGDLKEMQGEWKLVSMEESGTPAPDEVVKSLRVTIKGAEMLFHVGPANDKEVRKATIKLDSTQTPKTIELTVNMGAGGDDAAIGIYSLEGGKLKIATVDKKDDKTVRPAEFKSTAEAKSSLVVFERLTEK